VVSDRNSTKNGRVGAIGVIALGVLACRAVVALLVAQGSGGDEQRSLSLDEASVGEQAPAFDLPRLNGSGRLTLEQLRGHPVVLTFWASWCQPCQKELPMLQDVKKQLRGGSLPISWRRHHAKI
jgi:thiol-disulfide isomerase/thioredoxin